MKINVYGTGCAKCEKTYELIQRALADTGVNAEVTKVREVRDIVMAGVMSTPAVSVDGVMKVSGRVPELAEIKGWIVE